VISFVIANGTSRLGFDISQLKDIGTVFGCNAIYREYAPNYELPHYLIAIDDGMIKEIRESDFPKDRFIVPPQDECWEPAECNPARPRSNAGVNAMREAVKKGTTDIIALGFDFMLIDPKQSISNIYNGTANYGHEVRARYEDNLGRAGYLNWFAKTHPTVNIFLVYPEVLTMHRVMSNNINVITYDKLKQHIYNE